MIFLVPREGLCLFNFKGGFSVVERSRNFIFLGKIEAPALCLGRTWCLYHKAPDNLLRSLKILNLGGVMNILVFNLRANSASPLALTDRLQMWLMGTQQSPV